MSGLSGEDFEVGDVCKVNVLEGSKTHEATVLGIGEYILKYVTVHEKTKHNALDNKSRYKPR